MEIPLALREAMEQQFIGIQQAQLMQDAKAVSLRYRTQSGKGERLLNSESEAIAYAATRMPATYGAVSFALEQIYEPTGCSPQTLLDAGAGTGVATWAANEIFKLTSITCLEREAAMRKIGEALMKRASTPLQNAKWISLDLTKDEIPDQADLVIASYVLNEMTDEGRMNATRKLWNASKMILLLVEPGTPVGFANLIEAREMLLKSGAHILAPCPHESSCPKRQKDWCHFSCRVSRSRIHRQLKGGDAPYEDEKFIYMAFSHEPNQNSGARVLRHPQVYGGHMTLEICTGDGIRNIKLSKKDGERYKQARKLKWGDRLNIS